MTQTQGWKPEAFLVRAVRLHLLAVDSRLTSGTVGTNTTYSKVTCKSCMSPDPNIRS